MGCLHLFLGVGTLLVLGGVVQGKEKHVGCYYGVWSYTRPGLGEFWPEDIDVSLCDEIYYGFGNVLNDTFEVCSWDPWFDLGPSEFSDTTIKNCIQERDGDAWPVGCVTEAGLDYCHYDGIRRTLALKEKNPNLKVLFSVGGWTAGGWIFSQMAQTHESRNKFIKSVIHFLGYFGFDGLDLDWEFPALDMLPVEPTDPDDKIHFTALMKELREVFDVRDPPYLLTIAAAQDPVKADNAYETEKIIDYVDWFNVMSYDYSGAWDGFTGLDQPLYGKWGEGFVGHPHYQFNIHESIQYYLDKGVPPKKLSLGIHTEGKGFILDDPNRETSGVYCPASLPSPNVTFSRQEGWLFYYEVLQFFYNETIEDPQWPDLKPGIENWNVYDHEHGNVDGCYLSPFAYQGRYWISYDDEPSVDVKARYANHYGLRGAFIWEVDADNFQGLFNKEKFTILSAVSRAIESGEGLRDGEILGKANENMECSNAYPMCEPNFNFTTPDMGTTTAHTSAPECMNGNDCNEDNSVVCNANHDNCFYCDGHVCKPGCSDDINCAGAQVCDGIHRCEDLGTPGLTKVTVKTEKCDGCNYAQTEDGLKLHLVGKFGKLSCSTEGLDNEESHDYTDGSVAVFDGTPVGGNDDGLGECFNADLNIGVTSGHATWTGPGTWTPQTQDPICLNFFDPNHNKPTCCCNSALPALEQGVQVDLNCRCFLP